jgi:hypothetical protein
VKIAFLVLAHDQPAQLARLCRRLDPERHDLFIHIDAKAPLAPFEEALREWQVRARFTRRRVSVSWAGYSVVEAMLALIDDALASTEHYGKLVLLSGSCYPIKSIDRLVGHFEADGDASHISAIPVARTDTHLRKLFVRRWFNDGFLPVPIAKRMPRLDRLAARIATKAGSYLPRDVDRLLDGLTPHFGSQWWALTPACAAFVRNELARRRSVESLYRSAYAPDEQVIQTLVANSGFRVVNAAPRASDGAMTNRSAPLHWIHPSELREFTDADSIESIQRSDKFFIRKVSRVRAGELLQRIDSVIHGVAGS